MEPHEQALVWIDRQSCVWSQFKRWKPYLAYDCMQIGSLISQALARVGREGVVTQEESRTAEDNLYVVEGMQFDRGYISPYFVTDPERMVSHHSCSGLHV